MRTKNHYESRYSFGMQLIGKTYLPSDYRYGFNGKEKDNDIKNIEGSSYDYGARMYDPRVGRFYSPDPLTAKYPELTPYQYSSLNPIWNIDLDGLEGTHPTAHRRTKPILNNDFHGGGLISWLGGSRGKYYHNLALNLKFNNSNSKNTNGDDNTKGKDDTGEERLRKKDKPENLNNPLERESRSGEDQAIDNRTDLKPKYNEGTVKLEFDPGKDKEGNPVEKTYQIGVVDTKGNETILNEVKTNEPGEMKTDFKLKEGELLFKRETGGESSTGGGTKTSATKKSTKGE